MTDPAELFVDGPRPGWHPVSGRARGYGRLDVPVQPRLAPPELAMPPAGPMTVTYYRNWWQPSGWAVPIPLWCTTRELPAGAVLPGSIVGANLERCPI